MAEEELYLYHCDRCGELFKSKRRAQKEIRCDTCGEHPVKPQFADVTEMPALDRNDKKSKHGVPGIDEADTFSMKKKRQRKNWTIICLVWVLGLAVFALMANRVSNKAQVAKQADVKLDDEDRAYLARKSEAFQKCSRRFSQFANDTIAHSKSSHILNGSDLVLDINRYYNRNLMNNDLATSRIIRFDLIENGEQPKVAVIYKYQPKAGQTAEAYEFEVLFWKEGEDWFIDWPHFVRSGDMNWFRFGEDKRINSPKRFKLYAREITAKPLVISGYEEYKFSAAKNNSAMSSQLTTSVFVKHQTTLKTTLTSKFKEHQKLRDNKIKNDPIIGSFDPPKTIRLDVTVDFKVIEGETVMVLKEIHELDWEGPPSKEN